MPLNFNVRFGPVSYTKRIGGGTRPPGPVRARHPGWDAAWVKPAFITLGVLFGLVLLLGVLGALAAG